MQKTSITPRIWIAVASKNHVKRGVQEGIAQVCHEKASPLKRMRKGDPVLSVIKNKSKWGSVFRFGLLQIPESDFKIIAKKC